MKLNLKYNLFGVLFVVTTSAFAPANNTFTTAEQQQISIATPDLFSRSNAISIDLGILNDNEYSFPLPVGKAELTDNRQALDIKTKEGDVVKAMFAGVVRLSRNVNGYGNVIVIRHDNGLETVYANNAQNLVKVGQKVSAGRSIAIVGKRRRQDLLQVLYLGERRTYQSRDRSRGAQPQTAQANVAMHQERPLCRRGRERRK